MKAKLFVMNDKFSHVVYARTKEEAEEHFKSAIKSDKRFNVLRELDFDEKVNIDGVEISMKQFVDGIDEKFIPTIVYWKGY